MVKRQTVLAQRSPETALPPAAKLVLCGPLTCLSAKRLAVAWCTNAVFHTADLLRRGQVGVLRWGLTEWDEKPDGEQTTKRRTASMHRARLRVPCHDHRHRCDFELHDRALAFSSQKGRPLRVLRRLSMCGFMAGELRCANMMTRENRAEELGIGAGSVERWAGVGADVRSRHHSMHQPGNADRGVLACSFHHPSVHLAVYLCIHVSLSLSLNVCLSICLSL
eukprot:3364486-Rhodomonas_salina.1